MKKIILITLLFLCCSSFVNERVVYICDNGVTKVYHLNKSCRGLKNCKHKIQTVPYLEAIKDKRLCGWED